MSITVLSYTRTVVRRWDVSCLKGATKIYGEVPVTFRRPGYDGSHHTSPTVRTWHTNLQSVDGDGDSLTDVDNRKWPILWRGIPSPNLLINSHDPSEVRTTRQDDNSSPIDYLRPERVQTPVDCPVHPRRPDLGRHERTSNRSKTDSPPLSPGARRVLGRPLDRSKCVTDGLRSLLPSRNHHTSPGPNLDHVYRARDKTTDFVILPVLGSPPMSFPTLNTDTLFTWDDKQDIMPVTYRRTQG